MQITEKAWVEYITKMSQISQKAADLMQSWVQKNGLEMIKHFWNTPMHCHNTMDRLSVHYRVRCMKRQQRHRE